MRDRVVAAAWGQEGWADPSGVGGTCLAADDQMVATTLAALNQASQPVIIA